jgi:hypothetical protein
MLIKTLLCLVSQLSFICSMSTTVMAQDVPKVKAGDKIMGQFITYGTKGREVVVENTQSLEIKMTQADNTYTLSTSQGSAIYSRAGHVTLERESAAGKVVVAENQRFNWMPPGGDWSKPYSGSFQINNPNCGLGKMSFEATAKPAKFTATVSGRPMELDVQEVQVNAKWQLPGNCGFGTQPEKFVYSPQLDFVLERDTKVFGSNGFLIRGTSFKLQSIN